MSNVTEMTAPTLEGLARALDRTIEAQEETRERLDTHIEVTKMRFSGLENQLAGLRDTTTAQFLTVAGEMADVRKTLARIEEHIGLLTTMFTAHDKRFDANDARLDAHDKRFDAIDARLDAHDKRFDAIDARLDAHDKRLDTLTDLVVQIRDAVIPGAGS